MGLLFEPADESACPRQSRVEVIDAEKQEQAVAGLRVVRARQRGMPVGLPLVEAEQDRSIRVEDLPEIVMRWSRLRQPKQRLVPAEAAGDIRDADDRPQALHGVLFPPNRWRVRCRRILGRTPAQ